MRLYSVIRVYWAVGTLFACLRVCPPQPAHVPTDLASSKLLHRHLHLGAIQLLSYLLCCLQPITTSYSHHRIFAYGAWVFVHTHLETQLDVPSSTAPLAPACSSTSPFVGSFPGTLHRLRPRPKDLSKIQASVSPRNATARFWLPIPFSNIIRHASAVA